MPRLYLRGLEQTGLPSWRGDAEMIIGKLGGHPSAGRAIEEADLDEEGFVDVFDGIGIFGERCSKGIQADRPALVLLHNRQQQTAIHLVEAVLIDFEHLESSLSRSTIDLT